MIRWGPDVNHNPEHLAEDPTCTFWIQATPGTSYWRCLVPARGLGGQALSLRDTDIVHGIDQKVTFPRQVGPAVWQFPGNRTRGLIMQEMRRQGFPVFVEVDDNYLVPNKTAPGSVNNWRVRNHPTDVEATSRERHREIVSNCCDGVIVSTPHLESFYRNVHDKVFVCPNSVDPDDWPEPDKPDDGVFRIGYTFSSSHHYDWGLILPALEYASQQPGVEVVLMGMLPDLKVLDRFRFVNFPWANSLELYRKNIEVLDCGLAPIRSDRWSDSRSDIKVMEYAMAGAMAICSPTESYLHWTDGPCLMPLENTPKAWLKIVTWLLKNRELAREYAAEAKAYVLEERTIEKGADCWREAFASMGALV